MIQFGDSSNDEIKGVNLFSLEIGKVSLSIYKIAVYSKFEIYNGEYCFSIPWKYFYFGINKQ
jgi:hypothetical protein